MSYAIVLTTGAQEVVREIDPDEREALARALATELLGPDGEPLSEAALRSEHEPGATYPSKLLSSGHVALYRLLTDQELQALADQRGHAKSTHGVAVFDILTGESSMPAGHVLSH